MKFEIYREIVGEIYGIETIATGHGIHILGGWSDCARHRQTKNEDQTDSPVT